MSIRSLMHRLAAGLVAALILIAPAAAAAGPSNAQIRAAVKRAEKSPDLWATINVCNIRDRQRPGFKQIGVRVQMPALGFKSRLYMAIEIEYFVNKSKGFVKTGTAYGPKTFGLSVHSAHQDGVSFDFRPPGGGGSYLFRGVATLEWRIGKKVLGHVVRLTGRGYKHVDNGNPAGLSRDTCKISG